VRAIAVLAVVVGGLAACSPAPSPAPDAESAPASPSIEAVSEDLAPLDAYLYLEADDSPAAVQARWLRGQELVARCMAEHGFEYLPQPVSVQEFAPGEPEHGAREFAEQYGYAMFRQPRYVANDEAPDLGDVNADIKAEMSLAERAEYDRALHGTGEEAFYRSGDEIDLEVRGCEGIQAEDSLNGGGKSDPVFVDASAYSRHIDEVLLGDDPRVAAADAQWAECMSDAGWPGLQQEYVDEHREELEAWFLAWSQ